MATQPTPLSDSLDEAAAFLRRFVVFPSDHHALAVALWVAHTHGIEWFDTTPYLGITSPQKGSGKTRLMEILEELCPDAWKVAEPSAAVLFRKIDAGKLTLLLDEMDGVFHSGSSGSDSAQALRAILNAGNRRGTVVPRAANFGNDLVDFEVFCPKALAGLRALPDTLADRSIPIPMTRRRRADRIERFRFREARAEAHGIRERVAASVAGHADELRDFRIEDSLGSLTDRRLEAWEPLIAVAEAAGGEWAARAREAAVAIHKAEADQSDLSDEMLLLQHIREAFENDDRLTTHDLLTTLRERDDGPWARAFDPSFDDDNLKSAQALATMLRPYGIKSKQVRAESPTDGPTRRQGYAMEDFADAWGRYL